MDSCIEKTISVLFKELCPPPIKLIESIVLLGLPVETIRSDFYLDCLLEDCKKAYPEVILEYPPWAESISKSHLDVFFI